MLGIYLMLGALFLRTCSSLECYSCTLNSIKDQSCATIPGESVTSTLTSECHESCLFLAEFKENELWKLTRGCGEGSLEPNADDGIRRISIRCGKDFCNKHAVTAFTSSESKRDCYSCVYSYNGPGSDDRCVTDPSTLPHSNIVRCPEERECHVFQQYDKGKGLMRSFQRGCNLRQMERCSEDTHFITCNKFCDSHLCNYWDGMKPVVEHSEAIKAIALESKKSCYSCVHSYNGPGSDDRCVTDPSTLPHNNIVRCPEERECHVFQQYDKAEGLVRSFQRGCNLRQMEGCVEDTYFITCNTFCNSHLCNKWDGTKPLIGHSKAIKAIAGFIIPLSWLILAIVTN